MLKRLARIIIRSLKIAVSKIQLNLGIKKYFSCLFDSTFYVSSLRSITINPVLTKCNHECIMCWRKTFKSKEREKLLTEENCSLNLYDYERLFKRLPLSVYEIGVSGGGEPLLHFQIWQILRLIKKYRFYGELNTNGALLNKENIKNLFQMKWDSIRLSFHASNRKDYLKICGKDDFNKVVKAIKMIKNLRTKFSNKFMKVTLIFVIQKINFNEIIEFASLAEDLRVDKIEFVNLVPYVERVLLNKDQIKTVIEMLGKIASDCRVPNNALEVIKKYKNFYRKDLVSFGKVVLDKNRFSENRCNIVQDSLHINAVGEVFPCCFLINSKEKKMGNIKKETILKIWNNPKYKKFRRKLLEEQFDHECLKYCIWNLAKKETVVK